jgi:hypothetical protein
MRASQSIVSIRARVCGPVHAATAHSWASPGSARARETGWPMSGAAVAVDAGLLGGPGARPTRRQHVAELRPLATGFWQVAVAQSLLADLRQRVRATLRGRALVDITLPTRQRLEHRQDRLRVAGCHEKLPHTLPSARVRVFR